jgi:hypothetical protein
MSVVLQKFREPLGRAHGIASLATGCVFTSPTSEATTSRRWLRSAAALMFLVLLDFQIHHCWVTGPRDVRRLERPRPAGFRFAWKGVTGAQSGPIARLKQIARARAGPAPTTTLASARNVAAVLGCGIIRRSRSMT